MFCGLYILCIEGVFILRFGYNCFVVWWIVDFRGVVRVIDCMDILVVFDVLDFDVYIINSSYSCYWGCWDCYDWSIFVCFGIEEFVN